MARRSLWANTQKRLNRASPGVRVRNTKKKKQKKQQNAKKGGGGRSSLLEEAEEVEECGKGKEKKQKGKKRRSSLLEADAPHAPPVLRDKREDVLPPASPEGKKERGKKEAYCLKPTPPTRPPWRATNARTSSPPHAPAFFFFVKKKKKKLMNEKKRRKEKESAHCWKKKGGGGEVHCLKPTRPTRPPCRATNARTSSPSHAPTRRRKNKK